jgi:cytoskeletal protein CcmA (bactofilin family)
MHTLKWKRPVTHCLLRCLLPSLLCVGMAGAQAVETSAGGNVYLAGSDLKIVMPAAADLIAAGGRVSVERDIGADAAVAGGSVDVRAAVMQDLRVAGGSVTVERNVGGELVATGGTVRIERTAQVAGPALLAGGEVNLAGDIGKDARIYGSKITISGHIGGDTRLAGKEITLAPEARIDGNLTYASPNALPEALRSQVGGTITRLDTPDGVHVEVERSGPWSWFHPFILVSMLVAGVLLALLFPHAVAGTQRTIGQYPGRSLLTGLALMFAVPPVAILFMATVIGLPIGFALMLLYPLSLMLGYLAAAFFIGHRLAGALKAIEPLSFKKQVLFLALALLLLSVLIAIPFLGGFLLILAIVAGLGGWAVWVQTQYKSGVRANA